MTFQIHKKQPYKGRQNLFLKGEAKLGKSLRKCTSDTLMSVKILTAL